jgi:predicted anti-sigma-YlaC factor YlaD
MNEHATHWLGGYLDGELRGLRLRWVESHLAECSACQRELDALKDLRALLLESPGMEGAMAPERFVAEVGLRLPRRQARPPAQRTLEMAWRMAPAGLLLGLAFVQTVFMLAGVLRLALSLGYGGDVAALVFPPAAGGVPLGDVLSLSPASVAGAVQVLVGLVQEGAAVAWLPVSYVLSVTVIGTLYWSWLASWWVRRRHQRQAASNGIG